MGVRFRSLVLRSAVLLVGCSSPYGTGDGEEAPLPGDDAGASGDEAGANQSDAPDDVQLVDASDASDAATSAYPNAVKVDAPIGYWRLNITTGTEVPNEVVAGASLLFGGSSGHQLGVPGATSDGDFAMGFNGTSTSLIPIGSSFDFSGANPYTLECWIKLSSSSATPGVIIGRTSAGSGYQLYTQATQVVARRVGGDGGSSAVSAPITAGVFQHVVVVFNGAMQSIFVDGAERNSSTSAQALASGMAPFGVGADVDKGISFFGGVIDEVAVYDHALSAARVLAHFQAARQ